MLNSVPPNNGDPGGHDVHHQSPDVRPLRPRRSLTPPGHPRPLSPLPHLPVLRLCRGRPSSDRARLVPSDAALDANSSLKRGGRDHLFSNVRHGRTDPSGRRRVTGMAPRCAHAGMRHAWSAPQNSGPRPTGPATAVAWQATALDRDRPQPVGGQSATGRLRSGVGRRHPAPGPDLTPQCPSCAMRPQSQVGFHNRGARPHMRAWVLSRPS